VGEGLHPARPNGGEAGPHIDSSRHQQGFAQGTGRIERGRRGVVQRLVGDDAADEREAVGMEPRGGETEDDVAGRHGGAGQTPVALHRADGEPGDVVVPAAVEARELGRFAADERTAGGHAAFRDPGDHLPGGTPFEPPGREVVQEEERFRTLDDDVVHAHGDEVDADPAVAADVPGDEQLGADAVGRGDENGIAEPGLTEVERRPEPAQLRRRAAAFGRCRETCYVAHDRGTGVDVDAGVAVAIALAAWITHSRLPLATGRHSRGTTEVRNLLIRGSIATAVVLALTLASLAPVQAALPRSYRVAEVAVDTTAASAEAAREIALDQGQLAAFERLLRRLTLPEDHDRLPQLPIEAVTNLVSGFQVDDERVSPTRYRAKLTVDFRGEAVRELLRQAGIPFVEETADPVLVLPIHAAGASERLWAEPNPWREAWAAEPIPDGLVPFVVPIGDLGDVQAIDVAAAVDAEADALAAISARYGTGAALIAIARADQRGARVIVDVEMTPTGDLGLIGELRIPGIEGASMAEAMRNAVDAVVTDVREEWKRTYLLLGGEERTLTVDASIDDLDSFLDLRRRLADVPLVREVAVPALSTSTARFVLRHIGSPDQLAGVLTDYDLELNAFGGVYFLRPAASGPEAAPEAGADTAAEPEAPTPRALTPPAEDGQATTEE